MPATFTQFVDARFGGRLMYGSHSPGDAACALEAVSQWRGLSWTDMPHLLGMPDIRPLNDGPWASDAERTTAMIALVEALAAYKTWSLVRRQRFCARVAVDTVRLLIAELPGLPEKIRQQCRAVRAPATARAAAVLAAATTAVYADAATVTDAAAAAGATATAAYAANAAAAADAGNAVLHTAVYDIWIPAAQEGHDA